MLNVIPMTNLTFEFLRFCSGVPEEAVFWSMKPHHCVNGNRSSNGSSSSRNYQNTDAAYGSNVLDLVFLMFVTTFITSLDIHIALTFKIYIQYCAYLYQKFAARDYTVLRNILSVYAWSCVYQSTKMQRTAGGFIRISTF